MATIKVNNSNVMSCIEKASISITSPTGKTITLKKRKLDIATEELRETFWKFCGDPMVRFIGEKEASSEEMFQLLQFSKL